MDDVRPISDGRMPLIDIPPWRERALSRLLDQGGDPAELLLSAHEARVLTDEIRDDVSMLLPKIKEAYARHADRALGYESWEAYCSSELSNMRLPLPERRAMVGELLEEGMSLREVSSALGIGKSTAHRDSGGTAVPSGTQVPDTKEEQIETLLTEGRPFAEIAKEVHVSKGRVNKAAQRLKEVSSVPLRARSGGTGADVAARRAEMERMAEGAYTSDQIAVELGYVNADAAREAARNWGIQIPADVVMWKRRQRADSTKIVQEMVLQLDGCLASLPYLNFSEISPDVAQEALQTCSGVLTQLRTLTKALKERLA